MEVMDSLERGHGKPAKYLNRTDGIVGRAAIHVEAMEGMEASPIAQVSAAAT